MKQNFLIFQERYIQNPDIFRIRSKFRTLVYSKPEAYSKHCQTATMESFVKQQLPSALSGLSPQNFSLKKVPEKVTLILYFFKKAPNFLETETQKKIIIFQEMELSHISGKVYSEPQHIQNQKHIQNPDVFRTLAYSEPQHIQNPRRNQNTVKKIATQCSYISRNGNFQPFRTLKIKRTHSEKTSYISGN